MTTRSSRSRLRVDLPPRGCAAEVRRAVEELGQPLEVVIINGGALLFVSPEDICGLRALLELTAQLACEVTFLCPADDNAHRYLARMNIYADLPPSIGLSRSEPRLRRRDRRLDLVELARIASPADVNEQFGRVVHVGTGQFGRGSAMTTAFATAVAATTENSVEHASTPVPAMMSAQRYNRTMLELAIVDLGVGIPTTLRRNPLYNELDDATAIERSLDAGVSWLGDEDRGAGLADMMSKIGRVGSARLKIASNAGEILRVHDASGRTNHARNVTTAVRGTWLALRLATA